MARWYESQCDGGWEHDFGVTIESQDNPGWGVKIDLAGTECEGHTFARVEHNIANREDDTDWWECWTEDNVFHGFGGPCHLRTLLEAFRDWAVLFPREQRADSAVSQPSPDSDDPQRAIVAAPSGAVAAVASAPSALPSPNRKRSFGSGMYSEPNIQSHSANTVA